jgi:hypothetical protein
MAYFIFITSLFLAAVVLGLAIIRPQVKRNANGKTSRGNNRNRGGTQMNAKGHYVIIE